MSDETLPPKTRNEKFKLPPLPKFKPLTINANVANKENRVNHEKVEAKHAKEALEHQIKQDIKANEEYKKNMKEGTALTTGATEWTDAPSQTEEGVRGFTDDKFEEVKEAGLTFGGRKKTKKTKKTRKTNKMKKTRKTRKTKKMKKTKKTKKTRKMKTKKTKTKRKLV